jgi:hypothetical protein
MSIKAFTAFLFLLIFATSAVSDQTKEMVAISAAENFLQLVDSGQYSESWDATSNFFKQQVPKEQWVNQLENIRTSFGPTVKRELKNQKYTKTLPGAPAGEYVVIQFSTSFTNETNTIETITPMLENDGVWRVTGYYINK